MFRDDKQISAVVRVLLRSVHLDDLWEEDRPTSVAVDLMNRRGGSLSSGEVLMLLLAFDLWNGEGHVEIRQILEVLDERRMRLVSSLLNVLVCGSAAVDRWLAEHVGAESR